MTAVQKVAVADVPPNRRRGGDVRLLLSPRTVGSTSGFGGALMLGPGERVTEHYHPYSEEFVYVTAGRVTMQVDGRTVNLRADEALMVPIGARHTMRNDGAEPARLVFHLAPLAPRPELGHVDTEELPDGADDPLPAVGNAS